MAIAGLQNVSVHDSSFGRESQPRSSRRYGDERSPGTRASSLLQMWRVLEDEHVVSSGEDRYDEVLNQGRNDLLDANLSRAGAEQRDASEDPGMSGYIDGLQSRDLSGRDHELKDPNNSSFDRSGVFGEVERERVRGIFQDWMNSSRRERPCNVSYMSSNSRAEWLGETEQERVRIIREWVQMASELRSSCHETRGAQSTEVSSQIGQVLDGLVANQTEPIRRGNRKLCGRQVVLDMLNKAERQRQMELQGLMKLRAVSQFAHRNRIQSVLRGRFLRNDRIVEDKRPSHMAASELGLLRQRHTVSGLRDGFISRSDPSVSGQVRSNHSDTLCNSNVQTEANNSHEVLDEFHEQSEPSSQESDSCGSIDSRIIPEGNNVEDISWQESYSHAEEWQEQDLVHGARDWLPSGSIEFVERSDTTRQNSDENWQEEVLYEESEPIDWQPSASVGRNDASRVLNEQAEPISDHHTVNGHIENVEANTIGDMNWQEFAAQGEHQEEQVVENELTDWYGANVEYNEWRNGGGGDMDVNQQEASEDDREDIYMEEAPEVWQNWLEGPSDQPAAPVGRADTFYIPDDDNANSTELRELLNRRRVSSLLQSGFRESLDHLIQSYVERQSRASINWELHGTLTTTSGEGDMEQQSRDHNGEEIVLAGSSSIAHNDNWQPYDIHQQWEIINDMRSDMARMQQRMDIMQRMIEACMDMQLQLQHSITQEVSAALNWPSSSAGVSVQGSKWDYVSRGICCLCRESSIDSLLYRCGHLCTCSKCANGLMQSGEKCPMCLAPVVEVIRASISERCLR